jgi:hypothetical protein
MGIVETCRDLDQWLPALGPVGSDDGSMDEARWATILADTAFVDETGEKPNAEVLDNIRHRLLVFGGRDFPPDVPWVEKWIHFPEPGWWPVPAVLEVWLLDEGEDLDLYDLMIRPRQVEDVGTVTDALGAIEAVAQRSSPSVEHVSDRVGMYFTYEVGSTW